MPDTEEKRVVTTMPLEIDRVTRPAGTELTLSAADANALVDSGRAQHAGEELKVTDEKRAKLGALGPAQPGEEAVAGVSDTAAPEDRPETPAEEH